MQGDSENVRAGEPVAGTTRMDVADGALPNITSSAEDSEYDFLWIYGVTVGVAGFLILMNGRSTFIVGLLSIATGVASFWSAHLLQPQTEMPRPHNGWLIIGLGAASILLPFLSLLPWVMGSRELRLMKQGSVDKSGYQPTNAGMIVGRVMFGIWSAILAALTYLANA